MADVLELSPQHLAQWIASGQPHTLLDVRNESELEHASIPGALHIPMHEVQHRVREIPRGKPIVVMCHLGERSWRIARFLVTDGFADVYNLEGGIDAYSVMADSSVPRYAGR